MSNIANQTQKEEKEVLLAEPETELVLDGLEFHNIDEFYAKVSDVLLQGCHDWGHNLDAFNDVLRGDFGTPEGGYKIIWKNSTISRKELGESTFNTLVDIIHDHCPGGEEEEDNVRLVLE